jgi:MFS family permease
VQGAATAPLVLLGDSQGFLALVLVATFVGGVANLVVIVGFMVTVTTGLPDREQGLATGLATMSQQVGITLGIPVMSAIVTAVAHRSAGSGAEPVLSGLTFAIGVDAVLCLVTAAMVGVLLRPKSDQVPTSDEWSEPVPARTL